MKISGWFLGALAIVIGCGSSGPAPASEPQASQEEIPPAETGEEAARAVEIGKACAMKAPYDGLNYGYVLEPSRATARRDPQRPGKWLVHVPVGPYGGRLPPPGPPRALRLEVDLATGGCS